MAMPVRRAIEKLIEEKDLSYRALDYKMKRSGQYINSIVTGKKAIPQNMDFYEDLANAFQVEPTYFQEYVILLATDKVKSDPALAQSIIEARPKSDLIVYARDKAQKAQLEAYKHGLEEAEKNRAEIAEKENRSSA